MSDETVPLEVGEEHLEEIVERSEESGEPISAFVERTVNGEIWEFQVKPSGRVTDR